MQSRIVLTHGSAVSFLVSVSCAVSEGGGSAPAVVKHNLTQACACEVVADGGERVIGGHAFDGGMLLDGVDNPDCDCAPPPDRDPRTCGTYAAAQGWGRPLCDNSGTDAGVCKGTGAATSDCLLCCETPRDLRTCGVYAAAQGWGRPLCDNSNTNTGVCKGTGAATSDCLLCCETPRDPRTCGAYAAAQGWQRPLCDNSGTNAGVCAGAGSATSDCLLCCDSPKNVEGRWVECNIPAIPCAGARCSCAPGSGSPQPNQCSLFSQPGDCGGTVAMTTQPECLPLGRSAHEYCLSKAPTECPAQIAPVCPRAGTVGCGSIRQGCVYAGTFFGKCRPQVVAPPITQTWAKQGAACKTY
jgi:hypothetical protein